MNLLKFKNKIVFKSVFKKNYLFSILSLVVMSVLLMPKSIDFVHYAINILNYPYAWALTENENMLFIQAILSGRPLYQMTNTGSFLYYVYPPLFHFLSAAFLELFDLGIIIPRLISLFSFFFMILIVWAFFKDKKTFLVNAIVTFFLIGISLSIPVYSQYFILARVDMLAYAFAFFGVFFVWKIAYCNEKNQIYYLFAATATICAFFTKQSVFFPYLLIALLIFFVKDRPRWLYFNICLVIITGIVFFSINWITQGEFLKSMFFAHEVYGKYFNLLRHLLLLQAIFFVHFVSFNLAILFFTTISIRNAFVHKKIPAFSIIVLAAIYINFLIIGGNRGASYNTLIPILFGMLIAMKEFYFSFYFKKNKKLSAIVIVLLLVVQMLSYNIFSHQYLKPESEDRKNQATLVKMLKTSSTQWILGDRIDYAISLAGKQSLLEASTHNVAREWSETQPYVHYVEENLIDRIRKSKVNFSVVTITKFGDGNLLSQIKSKGTLVKTLKINYMDAINLNHEIYKL